MDHCFENEQCGIHGVCNNDGATFHCECTFLYDGTYCDKCLYYSYYQQFDFFNKKMLFFCFTDSSEAIQVIAACLFIGLACIGICVCKRSQQYKNNYRRRQIQRRNENR